MSLWSSTRARRVFAALLKTGWTLKRQAGSHRTLSKQGRPDFDLLILTDEALDSTLIDELVNATYP